MEEEVRVHLTSQLPDLMAPAMRIYLKSLILHYLLLAYFWAWFSSSPSDSLSSHYHSNKSPYISARVGFVACNQSLLTNSVTHSLLSMMDAQQRASTVCGMNILCPVGPHLWSPLRNVHWSYLHFINIIETRQFESNSRFSSWHLPDWKEWNKDNSGPCQRHWVDI